AISPRLATSTLVTLLLTTLLEVRLRYRLTLLANGAVSARVRAESVQVGAAPAFDVMEFTDGLVDVATTLFEVGTAGFDLTDEIAKLACFTRFGVVHADDRLDLVEREAEAFTA